MSGTSEPKVAANARPKDMPQSRGHGPGSQFQGGEKAANFATSARRLLRQLRPERVRIALVLVLSAIGVALNVLGPKVLARATDAIFAGIIGKQLPANLTKEQVIELLRSQGKGDQADMVSGLDLVPGQGIDFTQVGEILLLALGVYALAGVFAWLAAYLTNDIVQRTVYRMREQVADKLNRLPLSYFDAQPRGEILSRVTNDIDNVAQTLQQTLAQIVQAFFTVVGVVIMMLLVSPLLTLVAVVTIPLAAVVTAVIGKQSQKLFKRQWGSTGELNGQVEEAFTGHAIVKVFGRSREVEREFAAKNDELYSAAFGAQFISGIIMPVMFLIGNLNYVVIAVLGGMRVASGQMGLGDVQAFIQYSRMFTQPLTQLASVANLLQSGVASAERVFEVLDADEQSPDATGELGVVTGKVEFSHVDFSYSPDAPLIEDMNLEVLPGDTVAIVGPTGAGKTTLVNLIMRFYELNSGTILADGIDITTVPRADVRGSVGMVLQDSWLFHGTIRDNIAYGRPDASPEEILAAAKAAFVDRFVRSLPEGYDTVIDEEGSNVSAGERQLITIARAFLVDPSVLILDEATSSVDTRTELLVQRALKALRTDRTSFVIAHRLSTIRDADTILVMEHGAIVEQGSHADLLAREGAYWRLYQSQFQGTAVDLEEEAAPAH
ncbi:ABC transporter ATP-binding protein [Propionicicella superfundia]|uniref:ABC transporter ATP-binding protein n=1 Tax=Propionicicella superfundia TaxID=348582 RepID=UPI000414BE65